MQFNAALSTATETGFAVGETRRESLQHCLRNLISMRERRTFLGWREKKKEKKNFIHIFKQLRGIKKKGKVAGCWMWCRLVI
jgi:hypothetical protein